MYVCVFFLFLIKKWLAYRCKLQGVLVLWLFFFIAQQESFNVFPMLVEFDAPLAFIRDVSSIYARIAKELFQRAHRFV